MVYTIHDAANRSRKYVPIPYQAVTLKHQVNQKHSVNIFLFLDLILFEADSVTRLGDFF